MRSGTLLAVFLFGFFHGIAQPLHGVLLNAEDRSPVAYASLEVVGTGLGAATDQDGAFIIQLPDSTYTQVIRITCVGFRTAEFKTSALKKNGTILLMPEVEVLESVTLQAAPITAREILEEAIRHIPVNYSQKPFNMEFYSNWVKSDSTLGERFATESVFEAYSEGYRTTSMRSYRITQKRETGKYFLIDKTHGMGQWPMRELAFNDIWTSELKYDPFRQENFDKLKLELVGLERYDGDTVFVVRYQASWFKNKGVATIFVSAKDHAILIHRIAWTHKGESLTDELRYRKYDGLYFPYSSTGIYFIEQKVEGKGKRIVKNTNRVVLRRIELQNVKPFSRDYNLWNPKNVKYDEVWWEKNYPRLRGYIQSPVTDHRSPITGH